MKKIIFAMLTAGLFAVAGCKKDDYCHDRDGSGSSRNTPVCILDKIDNFSDQNCPTGANVKEYIFQGSKVYVFFPGTCGADMPTDVWDRNCVLLGSLDGFLGNTKINGIDFRQNATYSRTIWSN